MKFLAASLLALCAALPACAIHQAPIANTAPATAAASRQVLVMLRLPPQHYHPDAAYAGRYPDDSGRAARRRAGQELARRHGLKLVDDWPMPVIGIDCYVMEKDGDAPLEPVLAGLARDPRVAWAQPMNTYHGLDGSGDPLYAVQPAAKYWKLAQLHKSSTGRGVRIAVIDSGVDAAHPDLAGQVQSQQNFVGGTPAAESHGTAVAGIIAARAGNGVGIAGVAPDARVQALRACWTAGAGPTRCNSFTLGKALNFAIMNGAKVINLSLSGPADRLLQTLLDTAAVRGMVVVGAADPLRSDGGFPASYPGVIAVAGADSAHAPASALFAPGASIPTTMPGARWGFVSGPSYAAAHVAGLAALLAQLHPSANAAQLRDSIRTVHQGGAANNTAVPASSVAQAGNIDACATIARATGACACSCPSIATMKASKP
jgi:hypothetical protein